MSRYYWSAFKWVPDGHRMRIFENVYTFDKIFSSMWICSSCQKRSGCIFIWTNIFACSSLRNKNTSLFFNCYSRLSSMTMLWFAFVGPTFLSVLLMTTDLFLLIFNNSKADFSWLDIFCIHFLPDFDSKSVSGCSNKKCLEVFPNVRKLLRLTVCI